MIPVTFDTVATLQFGSEGHPTSLHFAIPEEWKTCKIRLHLRRSDGSFVPPMQLDENGCVKVTAVTPARPADSGCCRLKVLTEKYLTRESANM